MITRLRQATYAVIRMDWNFDPAIFQAVGQAESVTWGTWAVRSRGLTRAALAAQARANASAEQTRAFFQTGGPHYTGGVGCPPSMTGICPPRSLVPSHKRGIFQQSLRASRCHRSRMEVASQCTSISRLDL